MKAIYNVKALCLVVALSTTVTGYAQEDKTKANDVNREMTLEREYDPSVQDASKVNTLPKVKEPVVKKMPIDYSSFAVATDPQQEISLLGSGNIMTEIPFSKKRGYLNLGVGNYMNLNGDLGYHILSTEKDKLNFFVSHRSTNGKIEYLQNEEKQKAKLNSNLGGINFEHEYEKLALKLGFGVDFTRFNYYGYFEPYFSDGVLYPLIGYESLVDYDKNQSNTTVGGMIGFESKGHGPFEYALDLDFKRFSNKYGMTGGFGGIKENTFGAEFDVNSEFNGGMKIGVEGKLEYFNYGETDAETTEPFERNNHAEATLSPYLKTDGENWNLRLGANTMIITGEEKKIFFSPNITADVELAPKTVLYASATGEARANSAYEISRINRYINPDLVLEASRTWLDGIVGIKSGAGPGFWFDVFGGYKITDNEHFFIPQNTLYAKFGNVSNVAYYDAKLFRGGLTVKYSYQQLFNISLKGVYNSWTVNEKENVEAEGEGEAVITDIKAFGKPKTELFGEISVKPMENITLSMDYYLGTGRYTHFNGSTIKMDNINELNMKGTYQLNDTFGAYIKFNNLLFQKYELVYGYPQQGFNAMVGINLNF